MLKCILCSPRPKSSPLHLGNALIRTVIDDTRVFPLEGPLRDNAPFGVQLLSAAPCSRLPCSVYEQRG